MKDKILEQLDIITNRIKELLAEEIGVVLKFNPNSMYNEAWLKESDRLGLAIINYEEYKSQVDKFKELKEAFARGEGIQFLNTKGRWMIVSEPAWNPNYEYRVNPNPQN